MRRMIPKQVRITPEQDELLKQHSRSLGISQSELIRRGINQVLQARRPPVRDEQAWAKNWR